MNDHGWVIAGILRQSRYFAHLPSVGSSSIAFQSFMVLPVPMRRMVPLSTLLFFHLNIYSMLKINWQQIHCSMHILSNTILICYIINAYKCCQHEHRCWCLKPSTAEIRSENISSVRGLQLCIAFCCRKQNLRASMRHPWPIDLQPYWCGSSGRRTCKVEATKNCWSIYSRSACSHRRPSIGIYNEYIGIIWNLYVAHCDPVSFHRIPSSLGTIALEVTKCHN